VAKIVDLIARLPYEDELAGPAAAASNVAFQYDCVAGALLQCGDLRAVRALIGLLQDDRSVCHKAPPFLPLQGGYGKTFGPITVGDKAQFILGGLLGPELAKEASLKGLSWFEQLAMRLRWDAAERRFVVSAFKH
jgi:hypothetical protein